MSLPKQAINRLKIWRGDTLIFTPSEYLGDLTGRTDLLFTVKSDLQHEDGEAQIQVSETGGLLYINQEIAAVPLNGSISVGDVLRGIITITVAAEEVAKLSILGGQWMFDIQRIDAGAPDVVTTLLRGRALMAGDVTNET